MKINILTIGYSYAERVKRTVNRFFQETDTGEHQVDYYIADCSYPLPSKEENSAELDRFCFESPLNGRSRSGLALIRLDRNYGQDGNLNRCFEIIKPADDDIVAIYCPDSRASKRTWLLDMATALKDPRCGFMTTNVSCTDNALQHQGAPTVLNGVPCRPITWTGGFGISAFRGSVINKDQRMFQSHEFYGGTEANIIVLCRKLGFQGYMTIDHDDIRDLEGIDPLYQQWKAEVIVVPGKQTSFEEWLKNHGR